MKEEKIGVVILTIVFVGLVISLFFLVEPSYTGRAVGQCNDDDNGQNIYLAGVTSDIATVWQDKCSDNNNVQEGYCSIGGVNIAVLPCPDGYQCSNGFCQIAIVAAAGLQQANSTTTSTVDTSTTSTTSSTTSTTSSTTSTAASSTTSTVASTTTTNGNTSGTSTTSTTVSTTSTTSSSTAASTSTSTTTSTTTSSTTSIETETASETSLCAPDWQCDDWGECINGIKTRTCNDINNCGFKPETKREKCTVEATEEEQDVEEQASNESEDEEEPKSFNVDFSEVETKALAEPEGKVLTVTFDGKTEHTIELKNVTLDSVTLIIKSTPIIITLKKGETKNVDINSDGQDDFAVTLTDIIDGKASVDLKKLSGAKKVAKEEGKAAGLTGFAVADNANLGGIAAGIIWTTVSIGVLTFLLNRFRPRWWLVTRHGAGVGWQNTKDLMLQGFYKTRYGIKRMFGRM